MESPPLLGFCSRLRYLSNSARCGNPDTSRGHWSTGARVVELLVKSGRRGRYRPHLPHHPACGSAQGGSRRVLPLMQFCKLDEPVFDEERIGEAEPNFIAVGSFPQARNHACTPCFHPVHSTLYELSEAVPRSLPLNPEVLPQTPAHPAVKARELVG